MGAAISNYIYLVRSFVDDEALGGCLLATLAATCVGALFLLYRIVRRQSVQSAAVWTWCAVLLSLVLSGARIALARREVLSLLLRELQTDSWVRSRLVAANLARLFLTQLFTSSVMIPALLVMLVAVLSARSKVRERWFIALAASALLLLAVAVRAETLTWTSSLCSSERPTCWFEFASDSVARLQRTARYVVYAAALAWAVALVAALRTARTRSVTDGRATLASTALLLLGIGAFWLTRAEHADARHLLPPDDANVARSWLDPRLRRLLPMAKPGCSAPEAPTIELRTGGVSLDGQEYATPEALRAALARRREIWQQSNPNGQFPGRVLLAVARDVRNSVVRPWQLAAEQAGYAKIGAVLQVPTVKFQTRTVGALALERTCAEVWGVDGAGLERAFAHFENWGDLVAASGVAPPDPRARRSERSRCGSLAAPASPTVASFHESRILRNRNALDALLVQAKNGTPERIALRIEGTGGVMCECPPFSIPMSNPDEPVLSLLAIPMQNVANFGLSRTLLDFTAVGYFSGAWIDTYEYLHTQGEGNPITDEETSVSYRELTPEFCLEALCYWPREFALSSEYRARSHEEVAEMARLGIPKCRRE